MGVLSLLRTKKSEKMIGNSLPAIEEEVEVKERVKVDAEHELILYDDDFNTFDFVIESLIKVCKHELIQAEQCTFIVHYNGKCAVKRGDRDILRSMRTALTDRGLTAEVL